MIIIFETPAERRNFLNDCGYITRCTRMPCSECALEMICRRDKLYLRQITEKHTDFDIRLPKED